MQTVPTAFIPPAEELAALKVSPEVAWFMVSRGISLPEPWQAPLYKTPEACEYQPAAVFDPDRVDRVLGVFRRLTHTKGQWGGQPLVPDPWQVAYILAPVFGWVMPDEDDPDRWVRVVREAYVEVSRKNGKSTLVGGIGIYMTCADGEEGVEAVAAASTKDQARFVFSPVLALAKSSPALRPYVRAYAQKIVHTATNSEFAVVSSVGEGQHGANIHFGCVDELHVHKNPDLVEAIETGTGSRRQPLIVLITTADDGKPGTIYVRKRDRIVSLAARVFHDVSTYGVIWAAAESEEDARKKGLDLHSEEALMRANPGYGVSPTRGYLARRAEIARQSPAEYSMFLRLHLGIRTKQAVVYLKVSDWNRNTSIVDPVKLAGRTAYGGLDLAATSDLVAFCLLFPSPDGSYDATWRFWLPERAYEDLIKRTAREVEVWKREGRIKVTDGDVVDYDEIEKDILTDNTRYKIKEIGYDPWNAASITNALTKRRVPMREVRQGFGSMSAPLKEVQRLIMAGTERRPMLRNGGNPVARWCVQNLAVQMDTAGNVKPDRVRSGDKIDGVSALVTAMSRALANQQPRESAYKKRGLAVAGRSAS